MASAVFDHAITALGTGLVNWTISTGSSIYAALGGTTFGANVSKSTWSTYSQTTGFQVANGDGYTSGGKLLSLSTVALDGNIAKFDANDVQWTGATLHCWYSYTNKGTLAGAANPLLTYHDLGGDQAVSAGTLTLQWAAAGVFTIEVSAAV
jgi:hypothetical protein